MADMFLGFLRMRLSIAIVCCLALLCSVPSQAQAQRPTRAAVPGQSLQTSDGLTLKFKVAPRTEMEAVRLGDLVDVMSWGPQEAPELLDIVLAPAPAVGATQEWKSSDVLRHLELRGFSADRVRWSGTTTAKLLRANPVPQAKPINREQMTPAHVQDRTIAQAEANVVQATREYLWLQTGDRTEWRISVKVPVEHATALAQRRNIESIGGGESPWVGKQTLTYVYRYQGQPHQIELTPEIQPPLTVVVAARPIRRDEVIEESSLAYAALPERSAEQMDNYFEDMQELIGKQLRRSISTGLPIPKSAVGEPIVVSSGELIEIEAVSGSVSVKTAGRALSGGAVGEMIQVEMLNSRKRLTATVVGPLQVRITGGNRVPETASAKSPTSALPATSLPTTSQNAVNAYQNQRAKWQATMSKTATASELGVKR